MRVDFEKLDKLWNEGHSGSGIGQSAFLDSNLKWALKFVQIDFDNLTSGEYLDLQIDVNALCGGGIILGGVPPSHIWPDERLLELQVEILEAIRTFVREGFVEIDVKPMKMRAAVTEVTRTKAGEYRDIPPEKYSYLYEIFSSNMSPIEQGVMKIVRALGRIGHLLKECHAPRPRGAKEDLKCGRLFIGRKNRTYCSPACQNRATTHANRRTIKVKGRRIRGTSYLSSGNGWVPAALILTPAKGGGQTETAVPPPENEYFEAREDADLFAYELAKKLTKNMDAKTP
jgi:hypothetical protein